ncbi:MAG: histidinol-phosphatase [Bacteroidetes bacterium]|nr:histidinol-phosphatase [Bacteroidota bacterium]MBU1114128.1 histidinol-phosphatase [Bacteroidota bacterium]MBU1800544.1 histidinol-phosphatase [Bacteroidota bacterium]
MENTNNIFKNGSVWLKADFHLHTNADKVFVYKGADNEYTKDYIEQLKKKNIKVGVITNHNKFDIDEYKVLRKKAVKEDIYLLPGIEFSCKDGSKGIHLLIAYSETWIYNKENKNYIADFITTAFAGIANYDIPPYPNSRFGLKETIENLDAYKKDYFIILAHVDDNNGLFNELDGRNLEEFVKCKEFSRNVIGLQKSRNYDNRKKLNDLIGTNSPAFVEGSDPQNIEEVGNTGKQKDKDGNEQAKESYIKIGDFNFEAVKYALTDKVNRVSTSKHEIRNAYIKSIEFDGGLLNQTEINFSPELNNLIGIRGSGKSSILEILRYTLGVSLTTQSSDSDYKNNLIEHVLKSGGKVILKVVNEHGKEYRIEKIYGQKEDIYDIDNLRVDAPSIETIFSNPVYFGQKDLSNKNIDFEANLVRKLIGNKLDNIKRRINQKIYEIKDTVTSLKKLENLDELKKEVNNNIADAKVKLDLYVKNGVEDKLKQQSRFNSDEAKMSGIFEELSNFNNDLESLINDYNLFFKSTIFESEENKDIFSEAGSVFNSTSVEFNKLRSVKENISKHNVAFGNIILKLNEKKETLKEEFAKIKREIDIPNLNPDNFLKLNRLLETSKLKLGEIDKSEKKKIEYNTILNDKISELNNLWHEEYQTLEREVKRINEYENSLSINVGFKERTDKFHELLQQVLKGSGIRKGTYDTIENTYKDFIEIYRDFNNLETKLSISDTLLGEFKKRFNENISDLITFRVEDKFTIMYNGKPLKDHSLGQRATALILFLLAQKETHVLIIDQPEDDLDNQTIYEDVIKSIKTLKGEMQFIFATHNANIPVLGDSEKIVSCKYSDLKIDIHGGTIDDPETQEQIVTIMEGGEEAFNRRKNIYEIWSMKK